MKQVTLKYGIIAGVIVAVFMLLTTPLMKDMATNYDLAQILGYVSMLLSLSTVFVAIKTFRDKFNSGKVKFGKAFLIGIYITLIAGTIYSLTFLVYFNFVDNSFIEFYTQSQIEEINAMDISQAAKTEKIAEMSEQMEAYTNPLVMFLVSLFVEYFPVGLVVSLIAAAILRKK